VTGATERATWVRLFRPAVEARLVDGTTTLDVGERVSVRLEGVDVARGHLDFSRARDNTAA
jgi:exoribonuclease-2